MAMKVQACMQKQRREEGNKATEELQKCLDLSNEDEEDYDAFGFDDFDADCRPPNIIDHVKFI